MAKMFRCYHCGELFEEPIQEQESRGEFWGMPAYETMYYSPCCKDDFEEVEVDDDGNVIEDDEEEEDSYDEDFEKFFKDLYGIDLWESTLEMEQKAKILYNEH